MAGPENEPLNPEEAEEWEEEVPRSIFARTWFRVVIVVLAVGAVASIAVPYLLDSGHVSAPSMTRAAAPPAAPVASAPAPPPAQKAPAAPAPVASAVKPGEPPKTDAAKTPEAPKPAVASKSAAAAKVVEAPKQVTPPKPEPRKAEPTKTVAKTPARSAPVVKSDSTGELWLQVGAFKDPAIAKQVADGLKARGFEVAESRLTRSGEGVAAGIDTTPSGPADKYNVVVVGAAADITKKLSDKGLSAETVRDGAVVRPSLPLRDAVTLSNDLRGEGFRVTVRRVATGGSAATPAPVTSARETLYRVRVGAFADRAAANSAIEKLRALGYTPFVARGRE